VATLVASEQFAGRHGAEAAAASAPASGDGVRGNVMPTGFVPDTAPAEELAA
jgi:hypothetical protein